MKSKPHNNGMWAYLESVGVLEKGTEEQIKQAKRNYKQKYILEYKRKQRAETKEFNILLSKENGEYENISSAAEKHGMSVSAFLCKATLAYIGNFYIVPNRIQVAQLEQMLSECLNEIQTLVNKKEKYFWTQEQKFEAIEKRIEKLELEISEVLRQPLSIEELVRKAVERNSSLREKLISIISPDRIGTSSTHYDSQSKVA